MSDDLRNRVARAINEAHQLHGRSFYSMADAALAEMGAEKGHWKANCQSAAAALNMIEEAFGQLLPGSVRSGHERGPDYAEQAKDIIDAMHKVRAAIEPAPSVREAARVLLDALNEGSELDVVIQTAMQGEADTDGTDEWVFVLRAGLRAIAEGKDDE